MDRSLCARREPSRSARMRRAFSDVRSHDAVKRGEAGEARQRAPWPRSSVSAPGPAGGPVAATEARCLASPYELERTLEVFREPCGCEAGVGAVRRLLDRDELAHPFERSLRWRRKLERRFAERCRALTPAHEVRAPREPGAERGHQDQLAGRDTVVLQRLDQRNGYRRRRHVSVALHREVNALHRRADCALRPTR